MTTYILLGDFTDKGMIAVKDTVKRANAFRTLAKSKDVTVKDIYWTLGRHDLVATLEAPSDEVITALGLALGKSGNVRTQTLRAFSEAEMTSILEDVV